MSPFKLGDTKRVHPFLDQENDQEKSGADRLSNPSAQRLTASLDVILSAYSNIHSLANSNSKWFNDGLEDIVKLLDLCNSVSDNIADVKHYQTLLQSAIHCVDHTGMEISNMSQTPLLRATNRLADCKHAINNGNAKCNNRITSRSRGIVYIEEVISSSSYSTLGRSDGDLSEDMGNLKDCTASVLKTVAKALSLELPRASFHGQRDTGRCSRLRSLYERVKNHNRSKGSSLLLHQLVTADVLVKKLYDLFVEKQQKPAEVKELIGALKKCMADLDEGIAALDRKIKELYSALIIIRVTLLDILTYSV